MTTASTSDTVEKCIEEFLHEYYEGFEPFDLERMKSGVTEDFTAVFCIPNHSK